MAPRRLAAVLLGVALVVAGCGADRKDRAQGPASRALLTAQADIRKVVYTSELSVRVSDTVSATQQATEIARDAQGIVFAQSSDLEGLELTRSAGHPDYAA